MVSKYQKNLINNKLKENYEKHNNQICSNAYGDKLYPIKLYGTTLLQAK